MFSYIKYIASNSKYSWNLHHTQKENMTGFSFITYAVKICSHVTCLLNRNCKTTSQEM